MSVICGTQGLLGVALTVVAASCAHGPGPASAPPPAEVELSADELFILMVDAGRTAVLVERATEGAIAGAPADVLREPSELESAADSLHRAAHDLYDLRAITCENGLVGPEQCGPLPPPDWLGEPAGAPVSAAEIQRRLDWVQDAAAPFMAAGCDAGQSRQTGDGVPHFCSVE